MFHLWTYFCYTRVITAWINLINQQIIFDLNSQHGSSNMHENYCGQQKLTKLDSKKTNNKNIFLFKSMFWRICFETDFYTFLFKLVEGNA